MARVQITVFEVCLRFRIRLGLCVFQDETPATGRGQRPRRPNPDECRRRDSCEPSDFLGITEHVRPGHASRDRSQLGLHRTRTQACPGCQPPAGNQARASASVRQPGAHPLGQPPFHTVLCCRLPRLCILDCKWAGGQPPARCGPRAGPWAAR